MNVNIPPDYCQIRREYLYDLKENKGQLRDCVIFGMASIPGRSLLFHIMLPNGACYWRLPISAFIQKGFTSEQVPNMELHELELWNCFSYWPSVHKFDWLVGLDGKFKGVDK